MVEKGKEMNRSVESTECLLSSGVRLTVKSVNNTSFSQSTVVLSAHVRQPASPGGPGRQCVPDISGGEAVERQGTRGEAGDSAGAVRGRQATRSPGARARGKHCDGQDYDNDEDNQGNIDYVAGIHGNGGADGDHVDDGYDDDATMMKMRMMMTTTTMMTMMVMMTTTMRIMMTITMTMTMMMMMMIMQSITADFVGHHRHELHLSGVFQVGERAGTLSPSSGALSGIVQVNTTHCCPNPHPTPPHPTPPHHLHTLLLSSPPHSTTSNDQRYQPTIGKPAAHPFHFRIMVMYLGNIYVLVLTLLDKINQVAMWGLLMNEATGHPSSSLPHSYRSPRTQTWCDRVIPLIVLVVVFFFTLSRRNNWRHKRVGPQLPTRLWAPASQREHQQRIPQTVNAKALSLEA